MKSSRRTGRVATAAAVVLALGISLTACSSDSGGGGAASGSGSAAGGESAAGGASTANFEFLGLTENTTIATTLTTLSKGECKAENDAQPLKTSQQAQSNLDQQLQLLAGQSALPNFFVSANAPALTKELYDAGNIENIQTAFSDLGISDTILPIATSVLEQIYGGEIGLPTELNIEGIWYNKKILSDNGIEVPTTWSELTDAMAKLSDAGIQPVSNAGKGGDGWGITRWVGAYILRSLGPDALKAVSDGTAKLTDADYVAAAQVISDLGAKGYFGPSPTSIDYNTALNTFMTGGAAFIYMGSWALSAFNDPAQATIGADNIGFMKFPAVEGGKGSADQMPANVGMPTVFSAKTFDTNTQAWAKCIAQNYGTVALRDSGQITGFKVDSSVDVPPLSKSIQEEINAVKESVLWFEALFSAQATTTSQNNGGLLGAGQMSGEQFMQAVQADLDAS